MIKRRSLKSKLLRQLAIPLVFFMLIESILSYYVTLHYVNQAYDRWLLDSAYSLAQEIKLRNGSVAVELPPAALEMFRWDNEDKTFFKIVSSSRQLIAGDAQVPDILDIASDWTRPVYFERNLYGENIRVVAMSVNLEHTPELIYVFVAETMHKRRGMMRDILFADLFPQSLLLFAIGFYVLTGVQRGLNPLKKLSDEISKRSSRDLHPFPATHVMLEVKTLVDTINELFGRLTNTISAQNRFISNAAHQLRTPLAGLKLQAERALREKDLSAMQPALESIVDSADRLSHLVSQLLVLARAEPGQYHLEFVPVDLLGICREVCIDRVPKALERQIELSFDCQDNSVKVLGDAVLLRELISNLLENAISFSYPNSSVQITLSAKPSPCLIVSDEGPGISEAEREKVFERFYRSSSAGNDGCGLGLAIVKEIAELHQAQLQLEQATSLGGARFILHFPSQQC